MAIKKPFLGRGLSYPLQLTASGGFKLDIDDVETVRSALIFLLHTRFGERPHRPRIGTRLLDFKHETNSRQIRNALAQEIRDTFIKSEPRISDLQVDIRTSSRDDRQVLIKINFMIVGQNTPQNLVFPFYLGS